MAGIEKLCQNDAFFCQGDFKSNFRECIFRLEYLNSTVGKGKKWPTICGQYDEKHAIVAIGGGVAMMQIIEKCIKMHTYRGVHK